MLPSNHLAGSGRRELCKIYHHKWIRIILFYFSIDRTLDAIMLRLQRIRNEQRQARLQI